MFVRKITCAFVCILVLLLQFVMPAFAEKEMLAKSEDTAELWKCKYEYAAEYGPFNDAAPGEGGHTSNARYRGIFHPYGMFSLYPLLYTDAAQDLTFEVKEITYNELESSKYGCAWEEASGSFAGYGYFAGYVDFKNEKITILCIDEFFEYLNNHTYRVSDDPTDAYPAFYGLIKKYNISRKDLQTAIERMKDDPEMIRGKCNISDEDWENYFSPEKNMQAIAPEWKYDAMYLENENEMRELLALPSSAVVDGKAVTLYSLFTTQNFNALINSVDELLKHDLTGRSVGVFYAYLKRSVEAGYYTKPTFDGLTGAQLVAALEGAGAVLPPPPETGDNTAVFAVCSVVALAAAAAVCVTARKKRKEKFIA